MVLVPDLANNRNFFEKTLKTLSQITFLFRLIYRGVVFIILGQVQREFFPAGHEANRHEISERGLL